MSRRVLITSAGSGLCNNLMRSLRHDDPSILLIGCNADPFILRQSIAQRNFLIAPRDANCGPSPAFDRDLRAVITQAVVDLVIPGNDEDALVLAALHERESLPCNTLLSSAKTIALCHDKYELYRLLDAHNIPVPVTFPIVDRASLVSAWQALAPCELAWCRIRRGYGSRGATMVRDADQAWHWISYWNTIRNVPIDDFTVCEFLPGRDFSVQGIWFKGKLVLIKMFERLSYLNAGQTPSGMASVPALAKTVWEPAAISACEGAMQAVDPCAHGVYFIDLKQNEAGIPCVTEINACRFCMSTNIYDLVGRHSMPGTYVRLACGEAIEFDNPYDAPGEYYLARELDSLPIIFPADGLFEGFERVQRS